MVPVNAGEYVLLVCPVMAVPPEATVYHRYWPFVPPAAVSVRVAALHEEAPVVVGALGGVLIVPVTAVRVLSHVPLLMET